MGTTAPRARAATRALAVLAVLLGLLAMHGLVSTHHAAAASTAPHAGQADSAPAAEAEAVSHHHAFAMPAALHDAVALAADPGGTCDETCPDLEMLCVAVLTGAALALLLAHRRSSPLRLAPGSPRAPAPAPPIRQARGPDPVRELCVSRT